MAKRNVIISERDNIAALFEGDKALEFIIHRGDMLLGDVYLAEVENILPSIDAAFVNVGGDKMGFLHSSDVQGKGDLKKRLKPKQRLVVQVMKEPTGHKGPRVTTNISLPGRFLVLIPESKGISISRKIESAAERSRLKGVCSLIKPAGVGIIIRTEAQGQTETDIQEDFEILLERWQNIVSMADTADPPALLYRDQDLLYRVIRETVTEDVDEIILDTSFGYQRAQQLLQNWNLEKKIKISQYNGQQSIMSAKGVEREIRQALNTKVPMPSGGYLYIQPTEALTVIDVNSGKFTSLQSQSETIRVTNLEATKEIARQLRLRNIGGMIVVDFIDMESRADQLAILQAFEAELAPDKAKPQVGQLTDLGLVEMTRHRQGQALSEIFSKSCNHCHGSGFEVEDFKWASTTMDLATAKGLDSRTAAIRRQQLARMNRQSSSKDGGRERSGRGGRERDKGRDSQDAPSSSSKHSSKGSSPEESRSVSKESDKASNNRPARREFTPKPFVPLRARGKDAGKAAPLRSIEEFYLEKLRTIALEFADGIQVSKTPIKMNATLGRMNPKGYDVLTLVDSMLEQEPSSEQTSDEDVLDNDDELDNEHTQEFESTAQRLESFSTGEDENSDSNTPTEERPESFESSNDQASEEENSEAAVDSPSIDVPDEAEKIVASVENSSEDLSEETSKQVSPADSTEDEALDSDSEDDEDSDDGKTPSSSRKKRTTSVSRTRKPSSRSTVAKRRSSAKSEDSEEPAEESPSDSTQEEELNNREESSALPLESNSPIQSSAS